MHIADRMKAITASGIRKVFDMAASLPDPVNLSIGQPHFDVPEKAKEAAIAAIREGRNKYTPSPRSITSGSSASHSRIGVKGCHRKRLSSACHFAVVFT